MIVLTCIIFFLSHAVSIAQALSPVEVKGGKNKRILCRVVNNMIRFSGDNKTNLTLYNPQLTDFSKITAALEVINSSADSIRFSYTFRTKYFAQSKKWLPEIEALRSELEIYTTYLQRIDFPLPDSLQSSSSAFLKNLDTAKGYGYHQQPSIKRKKGSAFSRDIYDAVGKVDSVHTQYMLSGMDAEEKHSDSIITRNLIAESSQITHQHNNMMEQMRQMEQYELFVEVKRAYAQFLIAEEELRKLCAKK